MRKSVVLFLIVVCAGVCGGLSSVAELQADSGSGQGEIEPTDTSWMDKEVAVKLDENNMDENGCTYELSNSRERTAELTKIQASRYRDRETDVQIRVPDKVVKDGEEYVVTKISICVDIPDAKMRARFCFYMGQEVRQINWGKFSRVICYPHRESKYFVAERGVLFNHDKTELIHFTDKYYGADKVYEIPETVSKIRSEAFAYAKIKEVVLNDKITDIPDNTFVYSTLQKIDLKNVKSIGDYAFSDCKELKEVRIRREGVSIRQRAFSRSGIEGLYLPPGTCVDNYCDFEYCENLKTVIIGGALQIKDRGYQYGLFNGCSSLQTVILPEDMTDIMDDMFAGCMSLRKLYVPDGVESIGERAFQVRGNLTLYARKGSPAAEYEDRHVSFTDVSGHQHTLKEVLFMKYDTWGVKGKYCEECGYGAEIGIVEFGGGADPNIPVLEIEEDVCPEVLDLDNKCQDYQGVVYKLDKDSETAVVANLAGEFDSYLLLVPEQVKKDGKTYVVDTIGASALDGFFIKKVILPDSVKRIEKRAMRGIMNRIILGEGVKEIDDGAFYESRAIISIRGTNPCFKVENDCLYTADGSKLIKYIGGDKHCPEFKVPTRVRTITESAFYQNETIDRITIHNCGKIDVQDGAFTQCGAEISYMDGFWYEEGELVLELDENNMDENGCTYKFSSDTGEEAELTKIQVTRYKDRKTDIHLRIPDKVVKEGKEYVVTSIGVNPDDANTRMRAGFNFYIGKEVRKIDWLRGLPCVSACYPHRESKYFVTEGGVLFNYDKTRLIHFNNKYDEVYAVPETVSKIESNAFEYVQIKEVILNDRITGIPIEAFENSTLQKIDLKNVKVISDFAFFRCQELKEVRIRREGVSIRQRAFARSGIESLYLPPGVCVDNDCDFEYCENLKTVIIGGDLQINRFSHNPYGLFNGCFSLQTVILPEDMTDIMEDMFAGCMSLRKLYVPDSVKTVGERAFYVKGNLTLYARKGSPAAAYEDDNVSFTDVNGHPHTLKEVLFMKYDTWGVKGKYCEECGYGTEVEIVELDEESAQNIPVLEVKGNTCPEVLELDEYDTDEQGVIYRLDAGDNTASVIDLDNTRPFPKGIISVPEYVEKDGIRYRVEVIERAALIRAEIVILSDSVKELKSWSICNAKKLVLGKGVKKIDSGAFGSYINDIEIRGESPYYRMINGVLYTSDKKTLIKRIPSGINYFEKEYKVPTTVTRVMWRAFDGNYQLDQVDIYNCGEIEIEDSSFCYAETCYADGYTWYDLEDTIVDLDRNNQDENGFVYTLNGVDRTASLNFIDVSKYDKSTKELTIKIPDQVRKDGRTYKVTVLGAEPEGTAPEDIRIRLFIGKYVSSINGLSELPYRITSYINLENDTFTSEEGSLFDREKKRLYRFCDETFDCSSLYKFPAETEYIYSHAFCKTDIRKVDMNQVRVIGEYSFYQCDALEEIILRKEGMSIGSYAFSYADKLKYVYVPCGSRLIGSCFMGSGLKTIILGDGSEYNPDWGSGSQFSLCREMETCILPEDLRILPESLFCNCPSLKKLYIPREIEEIGEDCFTYVAGNIYAKEGGVVEEGVKSSKTAKFVSLKNHAHHMEKVTFFAFDTWAVTGDYCKECAYGTKCEVVKLKNEGDRAELPPLLTAEMSTPTPTAAPTATPAPTPTAAPTVTPTPTPTAAPTVTPTLIPTAVSTVAPMVTLTPAPTKGSPAPTPVVSNVNPNGYKQRLVVTNFRISSKNNKSARLQWKRNESADSYRIYRSRKKNGDYRVVKTVTKNKNYYVDKKIKPCKKYYYKVIALGYFDGRTVEGNDSSIRSICVSGICNPKISVKKGRMKQFSYVTVRLRKYEGKYADIYISINREKFKKLKLVSNKISKYKGRFKIQYVIKNKKIRFKVRTYRKKRKKKIYSNFSNVVKVKV